MVEAALIVCVLVWAASVLWFLASLAAALVPRWRRLGLRQVKLAAAAFMLSLMGVIVSNQFVYLDYGLSSRQGLDAARASKREQRKAERAVADFLAAAEKLEADRIEAEQEAQEAAEAAERKRKQEEERRATVELAKAAALLKKCTDTTMAFVMSQEFVKRSLKAPSTAEFPWINDRQVSVTQRPDCGFRVVAWVDAHNGFGAQIRSRYVVDLKYLDASASWQLTDIQIN